MYSLKKCEDLQVTCEGDVWLRESNHRNFVLSVLYVHPCFLYEDTLLHAMSKLLNVVIKRLKTLDNYQLISSNQRSRSVTGPLRC